MSSLAIYLSKRWSVSLQRKIEEDFSNVLQGLTPIGFLLGFSLIVLDYLLPIQPPSLLYAIIGLILLRQLLASISGAFSSAMRLLPHRDFLNQILLIGRAPPASLLDVHSNYWKLLEPLKRDFWLRDLCKPLVSEHHELEEIRWLEGGTSGISNLLTEWHQQNGEKLQLLVRVFNKPMSQYGERESMILMSSNESLLGLQMLMQTTVSDFRCHVLKSTINRFDEVPSGHPQKLRIQVLLNLASIAPPSLLIESQTRMGQLLWQRLEKLDLDRLSYAVAADERNMIPKIKERMPMVLSAISQLPLQISKSRFPKEEFISDQHVFGWGDWSLEPIGCGWFTETNQLDAYIMQILEVTKRRRDAYRISKDKITLASALFQFERLYHENKLAAALKALTATIPIMDSVASEEAKNHPVVHLESEVNSPSLNSEPHANG